MNPLDRGPTFLVLAGYRLVVLRPFCAFSTVFCVCLPRCFYCSRLVLFRSAACFVLFLHAFPATFVIFLWFGFSSLHMIPAADTSFHSLFLFIMLFHISFLAYFFIQKDLGLCGPNNVDWIKRVLGPIYFYLPKNCILQQICIMLQICGPSNVDWIKRVLGLIYFHLPKPFCQRTVFCGKAVFCGRFVFCSRFVFCCKLLLLALFFFGNFLLFGLLGGSLGLAAHWVFFLMSLWVQICKNGHQQEF